MGFLMKDELFNRSLKSNKKNNSDLSLKETIDVLMEIQAEDRLALYTLLSILLCYLYSDGDYKPKDMELKNQKKVIKDVFTRYDLETLDDIERKIKECSTFLQYRNLLYQKPLGKTQ